MSHLEIIDLIKDMPKEEKIHHECLDLMHFWMERKDLDIFEIMTLYKDFRKKLILEKVEV